MSAERDRLGRYIKHKLAPKAYRFTRQQVAPRAARFAKAAGRQSFRLTRRGTLAASRRAIGLTPREYIELRQLRALATERGLRKDETYLQEIRRLNELEARYKGEFRRQQFRRFARRLHQGPVKRLTA